MTHYGPVQWRQVQQFPMYWVSACGRVWSSERHVSRGKGLLRVHGKELHPTPQGPVGYLSVVLHGGERRRKARVHVLVAELFLGPRPKGAHVAHWDGRGANNRVENLRYATPAENATDRLRHGTHNKGHRHGMAKLTEGRVLEIDERRGKGESFSSIARCLGVSRAAVQLAAKRVTWAHVPKGE